MRFVCFGMPLGFHCRHEAKVPAVIRHPYGPTDSYIGLACAKRRRQRPSFEVATESSPEGKPLETTSLVVQITRGLIRQEKVRRRLMLIILAVALLLVVLGFTLLESLLDPREHPGWFVFYWFVCAWLTGAAILLAVFDMLMMRSNVRRAERELAEQIERESSRTSANR